MHPCEDVQDHYWQMALGGWKIELLELVKHGCLDSKVLQTIYFQDGSSTEANLEKHGKFLVTLLSKRAKSLLGTYMKPPWRYSGLTDPAMHEQVQSTMLQEWRLLLAAEEKFANGEDICILQSLHFLKSSFVRLQFLAAERDSLVPNLHHSNSDSALLARVACCHLGDTVVIENTHQKVKDLLSQARHETSSRLAKFHSVITSNVLSGRGIEHLKVSEVTKARSSTVKKEFKRVVKTTHPSNHKMNKEYQQVMRYKASLPGFTWPSTSLDSLFNEVASLELLVHLGEKLSPATLGPATVTCLVGKAGDLVAHRDSGRLLMVVVVGQYSFLAWDLEVLGSNDAGYVRAGFCRGGGAIQWHFLESLEEWLSVPSKPALANKFGPMVLDQVAEPMQLLAARIDEGLSLTVNQCKLVLSLYGVQYRSSWKKRDFYMAVFSIFLSSPEEQEKALEKSNLNQAQAQDSEDEEADSEFEDLLQGVEEFNLGDPDLKAEKEKLKQRKNKKKT